MLCHVLRTKERRNAVAFSSARYRPVEISYVSLGDRFAVVANCYGDEAVAPSIFVSISYLFFLSVSGC